MPKVTPKGGWAATLTGLAVIILFAVVAWSALGFPREARFLPLGTAAVGLIVATIDVVRTYTGRAQIFSDEPLGDPKAARSRLGEPENLEAARRSPSDQEPQTRPAGTEQVASGAFLPLLWLAAFTVAYLLTGAAVGTFLFGLVFLRFGNKVSWLLTLLISVLSAVGLYALVEFVGFPTHAGYLTDMVLG